MGDLLQVNITLSLLSKWPVLFVISLITGTLFFGVLYKYQIFMFYLLGGVFLFVIGLPVKGWFGDLNRQFIFGIDIAILLVFLTNIFLY